MGDEGKVCFYQNNMERYHNYLRYLDRAECISCSMNGSSDACDKKYFVSIKDKDLLLEDNFKIWKEFNLVNGVEKKVLESED